MHHVRQGVQPKYIGKRPALRRAPNWLWSTNQCVILAMLLNRHALAQTVVDASKFCLPNSSCSAHTRCVTFVPVVVALNNVSLPDAQLFIQRDMFLPTLQAKYVLHSHYYRIYIKAPYRFNLELILVVMQWSSHLTGFSTSTLPSTFDHKQGHMTTSLRYRP